MSTQYLFLAPGNLDKNGILDALDEAFPPESGEEPVAGIMPGTRKHEGKWAVHTQRNVTQEELQGALNSLAAWELIAEQDFDGTVRQPVPLTFIDWIEDRYDENGNPVRPTFPVPVPHVFAGAAPWVWEQPVPPA